MTAASASPEFITLGGSIAGSQQSYDHPYNCRLQAFRRCAAVRMRQIRPVVALSVTPPEGKDQTKTIERAVLLTAFASIRPTAGRKPAVEKDRRPLAGGQGEVQ